MNLTEYCKELATATTEAIQWIGRNEELVRNEQAPLQRDLRRAGRIFSRCARAAARKMCAGVFGPSQAGKSYLISALARDAKGQLMACFGDEVHDFISKINPEGGRESTGLVTRFTLTKPDSLPQGFPVQLRLLTETDVVKIIANSYFCNCEHREDPQSDVNATLNLLEKRAGQGDPHIDINAMEDLCDYIREFRAQSWVRSLEKTYWNRAIELGPQLSLDDRVRLYASEWKNFVEITDIYEERLYVSCADADRLVAELTPPGGNRPDEEEEDEEAIEELEREEKAEERAEKESGERSGQKAGKSSEDAAAENRRNDWPGRA